MNDLPYQAEYAKSGKSTCKNCKQKIDNGALRIAVMIQSVIFDGKQAFWHHPDCFFNKFRPATFNDIANFNQLRNSDQKMIKSKIVSFNKVVMPDEPDADVKVESKAEKRAADSGDSQQALSDYRVEYAKSTRVTCNYCNNKIVKDEIRIKKIVYDTEAGCKYGGQSLWHHVSCFAEMRSDLMYFAGGENIPGFDELKEDDQKLIKETIKPFKLDEIPLKKLKEEKVNDSDEMKDDKQKATLITRQNISFQRIKKVLSEVKKKDIQEMLDLNGQMLTTGPDERLNHLADCMVFGALSPCPECEQGQLVLESFGYKCTGNLSAWTKCSYVTQEPKRQFLKLTTAFKTGYELSALKNYKPKIGLRLFLSAPKPVVVLKEEPYASTKSDPPLKNFEFFLFGTLKKQDETKESILQLGGVVVTTLSDTVVAVISTKNEVDKMSPKMKEIKKLNLVVVEETFLDSIDPKGTITNSLQIIKENNIADWGADPACRIPPEMLKPKPGSRYESTKLGQVKLNIQGGTIVDPDSGLAAIAHVYKDSEGTKYTVVLTQTDIVAQKNSYYKMQVLEGNNGQFYWLFRSWGRIGTSIGHHKSDQMKSAKEAVKKFEDLYEEKTKNSWQSRNNFIKVPGRYCPLDIDYSKTGDDTEIVLEVDAKSKLPVSVQKLVIKFFDVKHMKKIMLEFELDTEKMPLGKISKNQINSGYKVLSELLNLIENGSSSQNEIVDATNRFFTLIPHDFGIQNAPLLNNVDIIKAKTEMLHNLLEIETAYSLLKLDGDESKGIIDAHFLKLKCDMAPIPKEAPEYKLISEYLRNTHGYTHHYKLEIEEVFKVVREGEDKKYLPFKKLHNRRLLWHGSRITNFAGIISQGLRIAPPEAPVAGYMFGKGIYFADMVTKSANYCCTSSSNPVGVMMLCEVALGTMRECYRAEHVQLLPHEHSAWGIGRTQPDPKQNRIIDDQVIVPLGKPVPNPTPPYKCVEYNEDIIRESILESNNNFKKRQIKMMEIEHSYLIEIAKLKIKKLELEIALLESNKNTNE